MREVFKRVDDGMETVVEVDTEVLEYKGKFPWLFSVFIKFDSADDSSQGYEEFLETKESLIIAIEYEDNAKYVGSRVVDGWSEFYFYCAVSKELETTVTAILKECGYVYESNVVKDTKWGFYETQLFPTDLEFANIQSDKIISLLQEEGDDLSVERDVEHYISFDTPTQKDRFLKNLDIDGFSFKDDISSEEFENGIALVKSHSVTSLEVQKVVKELFKEIEKEHGFYEGWSTTLVNSSEV